MSAGCCIYQVMAKIDARMFSSPRTTLPQLAQDLGIDRHTIERVIEQLKGVSFRKHQQSVILDRALRMLKDGSKNTEVASVLGYRSAEAFSRFIKVSTGMNAREIRRASNGNGGNGGFHCFQLTALVKRGKRGALAGFHKKTGERSLLFDTVLLAEQLPGAHDPLADLDAIGASDRA